MADRRVLTDKRIGVLMGGQSSERDVSLRTGQAVHQSLLRRGYQAIAIDVGPNLFRDVTENKIELAFLSLHGPGGEDGTIQGFLETLGIPYTGSGVQASAMGMHKVTTKTLAVSAKVPVPAGTQVRRGEQPSLAMVLKATKLKLPVVVKPASQGSTIECPLSASPRSGKRRWPWPIATIRMPWSRPTFRDMKRRCRFWGTIRGADDIAGGGNCGAGWVLRFFGEVSKGKTQYLCRLRSPPRLPSRLPNWRGERTRCWVAKERLALTSELLLAGSPTCWRSTRCLA